MVDSADVQKETKDSAFFSVPFSKYEFTNPSRLKGYKYKKNLILSSLETLFSNLTLKNVK